MSPLPSCHDNKKKDQKMNTPRLTSSYSRRAFLKNTAIGTTATMAALMLPMGAVAALGTGNHINALKIPPLDAGRIENGVTVYDLGIQRGITRFFDGIDTPTLGINGSYLGTTIKMQAGHKVRINVKNGMGATTTLHWHGMHLPAKADGGPHQPINQGATWSPEFEVKQKAASFWYHAHQFHQTADHVWQGLAGMIIVGDEESDALGLPATYGLDDVPIVLQDRRFSQDGRMDYEPSRHDTMMGMIGGIPMVNGTIAPYLEAKSKLLRLRILNGSNASIYNLAFDDNRPFKQIATDGGLLETPYETRILTLAPGERAEIIVDCSGGRNFMLTNLAGGGGMMGRGMGRGMMGRGRGMMMGGGAGQLDFLEIRPTANLADAKGIPDKLAKIDWINPATATKTRRFVMEMQMGPMMMLGLGNSHTINGKAMKMNRIDETVKMGTTEIWEIGNTSPLPHPFHVHDVQFQIIDRNGQRPHPGEQGLKDTVLVNPGEMVRVVAEFKDYADPDRPYMYHCHILEHEDAGMMGQFVVV